MADEPETREQYENRRTEIISERLKADLIKRTTNEATPSEGENKYERARLDVYPRPTV